MFPLGTKIKKFNNKTNIIAQVQSIFDKEINKFYVPLSIDPFDKTKIKKEKVKENKNKTKKMKKEPK
jgi:hypothetical protein